MTADERRRRIERRNIKKNLRPIVLIWNHSTGIPLFPNNSLNDSRIYIHEKWSSKEGINIRNKYNVNIIDI